MYKAGCLSNYVFQLFYTLSGRVDEKEVACVEKKTHKTPPKKTVESMC